MDDKTYIDKQEITTMLVNQIKAERQAAFRAIDWAEANLSEEQRASLRHTLLKGSARVRNIDRALHSKPAAAIFGESQVGKSYLVKNLLKDEQGRFSVCNPASGEPVNFLSELNPPGGGAESTSLITRFTVRPYRTPSPAFPIKAVVFTPMDVVLTMADSFFSDVKNHSFLNREQLQSRLAEIVERYGGSSPVQEVLTPEDLYEMDDYLNPERFPIARTWLETLRFVGFFPAVARVIAAASPSAWADIFSVLWNDNSIVTDIFRRLINLLRELDFAREVYISIAPLLSAKGTILSVDRIKEFFGLDNVGGKEVEKAAEPLMQVYTKSGVKEVKKSEFTSIAAEVVLQIPEQVAQTKAFLRNLDILDFPGARSRENMDEHDINAERACTMVLRGRVAYLFNKYSRNYLITTLLFCYHNQQSNVKTLSELIGFWIDDMIGSTPEERAAFLSAADIAPLFVVGTKFNLDLNRNNSTEKASESEEKLLAMARNRWENRFSKFLPDIIDGNEPESWFNNWIPGRAFDNLYLLRDYEWSAEVFSGYLKTLAETGVNPDMEEHLSRLRATFLEYPAVRTHFRNPAEAWERSATPGQDGSEYIIENLVAASAHAVQSRDRRFASIVSDYFSTLFETVAAYYHDDDSATRVASALRDAGRISFMLDTLFTSVPRFFSDFLSAMTVSEDKLHDKVLDLAGEIAVVDRTDLRALLAIRQHAGISPSLPREENIRRLMSAYHASSISEIEAYLQRFGYTLDDVINPAATQNLPRLLLEQLEQYWFDRYLNPARLQQFKEYGITEADLEALTSSLKALYTTRLATSRLIRERIAPYVTTPDRLAEMADIIADIVAQMFNKFVNSFGTDYFTSELWDDVLRTAEMAGIKVEKPASAPDEVQFDERRSLDYLGDIFNTFEHIDEVMNGNSPQAATLEHFSNYCHYNAWARNLKIGFLASCDIPKFDIEKNERLRQFVVHEFCEASPSLSEMARSNPAVCGRLERMRLAAPSK